MSCTCAEDCSRISANAKGDEYNLLKADVMDGSSSNEKRKNQIPKEESPSEQRCEATNSETSNDFLLSEDCPTEMVTNLA